MDKYSMGCSVKPSACKLCDPQGVDLEGLCEKHWIKEMRSKAKTISFCGYMQSKPEFAGTMPKRSLTEFTVTPKIGSPWTTSSKNLPVGSDEALLQAQNKPRQLEKYFTFDPIRKYDELLVNMIVSKWQLDPALLKAESDFYFDISKNRFTALGIPSEFLNYKDPIEKVLAPSVDSGKKDPPSELSNSKDQSQLKMEWKKEGLCPECGHKGEWIRMAAVCPEHGKFLG